ncbi:MAG: tol-pal system-associated acyl-CoA thioesterase [Gammaproteobacteria bacterium]|nr:tol-pal system-associated acyl-CoA thioesterase [Gammaproteobacteria bacterium]
MSETYSATLRVRVYYEDTDAGGVVYHSNYLKFMERARTEMLRDAGFNQYDLYGSHRIGFAVRRMAVEFIRPARLDQELTVTTTVTQLRRVSVEFRQEIHDATGEALCSASVVVACIGADEFKPAPIPAVVAAALAGH